MIRAGSRTSSIPVLLVVVATTNVTLWLLCASTQYSTRALYSAGSSYPSEAWEELALPLLFVSVCCSCDICQFNCQLLYTLTQPNLHPWLGNILPAVATAESILLSRGDPYWYFLLLLGSLCCSLSPQALIPPLFSSLGRVPCLSIFPVLVYMVQVRYTDGSFYHWWIHGLIMLPCVVDQIM